MVPINLTKLNSDLLQQKGQVNLKKSESTVSHMSKLLTNNNFLKIYKSTHLTQLPKQQVQKTRSRKLIASSLTMASQNAYNQPNDLRFSYDTVQIQD